MFEIDIKGVFKLEMNKADFVILTIFFIVLFSLIGVVAQKDFSDAEQGHPISEIDFSEGEANDDLLMGNNDIIDIGTLYSENISSNTIFAEELTNRYMEIHEQVWFPEPEEVLVPPGIIMPFVSEECPKGWSNLDVSDGKVLVGYDEEGDSDVFGTFFGEYEGNRTVEILEENMPDEEFEGVTGEPLMGGEWDYYKPSWRTTRLDVEPNLGSHRLRNDKTYGEVVDKHYHEIEAEIGLGHEINNLQSYINVLYCVKDSYDHPQEKTDFEGVPDTEKVGGGN